LPTIGLLYVITGIKMNIDAEVTGNHTKNTGKEEKEIWEKKRCNTCGICSSTVYYIELSCFVALGAWII
jgi:hypothetical protein